MTPEELREWRERLGLSQRKLAEALGVHWMTIYRWENGKMQIERPQMLRLSLERLAQQQEEK